MFSHTDLLKDQTTLQTHSDVTVHYGPRYLARLDQSHQFCNSYMVCLSAIRWTFSYIKQVCPLFQCLIVLLRR